MLVSAPGIPSHQAAAAAVDTNMQMTRVSDGSYVRLERDRVEKLLTEEFRRSLKDLSNEELAQLFEQAFLSTGLSARDLLPSQSAAGSPQPGSPTSSTSFPTTAFGRASSPPSLNLSGSSTSSLKPSQAPNTAPPPAVPREQFDDTSSRQGTTPSRPSEPTGFANRWGPPAAPSVPVQQQPSSSSSVTNSSAGPPPRATTNTTSTNTPTPDTVQAASDIYDDEDERNDTTRDLFGSLLGGSLPGGRTNSSLQQAADASGPGTGTGTGSAAAGTASTQSGPGSIAGRLFQSITGSNDNTEAATSSEGPAAEETTASSSPFPSLPSLPSFPSLPSPPSLPSLPSLPFGFGQPEQAPLPEPDVAKDSGEEEQGGGLQSVLDAAQSAASAVSEFGEAVGQVGVVLGGVDRGNVALFAGGALAATAAVGLLVSQGGPEAEEQGAADASSSTATKATSTTPAATTTPASGTAAAPTASSSSSTASTAATAAALAEAGGNEEPAAPAPVPSRLRKLLDNGPDASTNVNAPAAPPQAPDTNPAMGNVEGGGDAGSAPGAVLWQRSEPPVSSTPPGQTRVLWERPSAAAPLPPPPVLPSYTVQQQGAAGWQPTAPPAPPPPPAGASTPQRQGPQGFMNRFFASRPWGGSTATATPVMDPVRTAAAPLPDMRSNGQLPWRASVPPQGAYSAAAAPSRSGTRVPPDPWTGSTLAPGPANSGEAARVARAIGLPVSDMVLQQPTTLDISVSPWDEPAGRQ